MLKGYGWMTGGDGGFVDPSVDRYRENVWKEYVTFSILEDLINKRTIIQRKIDAARKRLKRLTSRLNVIEGNWNPA